MAGATWQRRTSGPRVNATRCQLHMAWGGTGSFARKVVEDLSRDGIVQRALALSTIRAYEKPGKVNVFVGELAGEQATQSLKRSAPARALEHSGTTWAALDDEKLGGSGG